MSLSLRDLIEQAQKLAFDNPELLGSPVVCHNATNGETLDCGDYADASAIVFAEDEEDSGENTVLIVIR